MTALEILALLGVLAIPLAAILAAVVVGLHARRDEDPDDMPWKG